MRVCVHFGKGWCGVRHRTYQVYVFHLRRNISSNNTQSLHSSDYSEISLLRVSRTIVRT